MQVGSKVVYTANTYDFDDGESYAFNGEVGIVININYEEGSVEIDFGDRTVIIPPLIVAVYPDGRAWNRTHDATSTMHTC